MPRITPHRNHHHEERFDVVILRNRSIDSPAKREMRLGLVRPFAVEIWGGERATMRATMSPAVGCIKRLLIAYMTNTNAVEASAKYIHGANGWLVRRVKAMSCQ